MTQSILLVLIAINIAHDIMTSQWLLALFDCLVVVPAWCMLTSVWWRERHQT